jgi:cell division protein FtsB
MPFHRANDHILDFRRLHRDTNHKQKPNEPNRKPLHPAVRRRRLIWLGVMVIVLVWTVVELIVQQNRIWDKEKELAVRKMELATAKEQTKQLKEEIKKLHDESYLLELAHKMGYGKPGEEIYSTEKE